MKEEITTKTIGVDRGVVFRSWVGILLPPIAWAAQLQTVWLTTEYGCMTADFTWNHVASIVAIVLSLLGLSIAFGEWRGSGGGTDDDEATRTSRRRFMGLIGILTGALFTAVIFAQWLPTLTGVPCDK
jgi:hypothetical protein